MYIKRKPLPQVPGTRAHLTRPIVPKKQVAPQEPGLTDEERLQQLVELRKQIQLGPIQAAADLLRTIDDSIGDLQARLQWAPKRREIRKRRAISGKP